MRKVAILIAVEDYADKKIYPVKYAEADARDLAATFDDNGFSVAEQTVLINVNATRTSIKSRVRKVLAGLTKEDTLYIYYAGHGFARNGKNFITCFDTRLDDLEGTSIAVEWLFSQFKQCASTRIVLFLDSCESGMLATTEIRGIYTDLTEDELKAFFDESEHCVCFAACKPGQYSYPADKLKHGIWTYHLIEALNANAPTALEYGHLVTSSSLQNHLHLQVPRTLRTTLTGTAVQTPWVYGALSSEFLIADVAPILKKRKAAANPHAQQLREVRLYDEQAVAVRKLSGFRKGHHVPDRVTDATESFVATISEKDISDDLDEVHDALRGAFEFKRKDLQVEVARGGGSIITPYFDYEVTVSLDPDDPSGVVWRREVHNIREPDKVQSDEFDDVFRGLFDTLEFSSGRALKIEEIVDQIEALDNDEISVTYDKNLEWCTISVDGIDATIRVTKRSISIVRSAVSTPKLLIQSFFDVQKKLIDTHQLKQLPFSGGGSA